jgi:hypothetical protein
VQIEFPVTADDGWHGSVSFVVFIWMWHEEFVVQVFTINVFSLTAARKIKQPVNQMQINGRYMVQESAF